MATAMEAPNPHHHNGHGHHQPHAPLPASPTLTNPDMILPDYDRSTSPDPDLNGPGRDHSPLMMWKNAHAAAASAADMHHMFAVTTPRDQRRDPYGPTGPITPTTPIIYGNGTMLSDIGEVTEVESTPGKSPSRNRMALRRLESPTRGSGSDAALRSSPTMGITAIKSKATKNLNGGARERRSSLDSNSTITTEDHAAMFADFDDSVSVGDSVFQGDDEESMASSYAEGIAVPEPTRLGVSKIDNIDRLSTYSTSSLSRRAEEILANAKKRLTTMEGNLTRARSSLHVGATPYGSDASTPSPPFQRASTAMYSRDTTHSTPEHSPGHSRITSDIAMRNGLPYRVSAQRSQSALGAAGGYRQPLLESKSADHIGGAPQAADSSRTMRKSTGGLHPLSEDQVAQLEELHGTTETAMANNFLSPTFGSFNDGAKGLQRSASAAQMRDIKDIKDQMKDLKGKISSLREQARVDSMKRRSLQSLRTPSPFTHSQIDQWYAEPPPSERNSVIDANAAAQPREAWNGEDADSHDKDIVGSTDDRYTDGGASYHGVVQDATATQLRPALARPTSVIFVPNEPPQVALEHEAPDEEEEHFDVEERFDTPADLEERFDTATEMYEDMESDGFRDAVDLGYESESGESLYHDTVQHMVSHEDREDAFDYEHFFLHSAMGTMRRDSLSSYTSEGSIETTKGPTGAGRRDEAIENEPEEEQPRPPSSDRRNSTTSISTIDTFATAEEERSRRSVDMNRDVDSIDPMSEGQASSHNSTVRPRSAGTVGHRSLSAIMTRDGEDAIPSIPEECEDDTQGFSSSRRLSSAFRRPMSMTHRPSVSSFDSTGTNRSFPLVNKTKVPSANSTGVLTPNSSPDQELKSISDALMAEAANAYELQQQGGDDGTPKSAMFSSGASTPQPLHALLREDKYLVERIVAELGKCVLGLTESGRASAESRMYRRRIDAARRILEGLDEPAR